MPFTRTGAMTARLRLEQGSIMRLSRGLRQQWRALRPRSPDDVQGLTERLPAGQLVFALEWTLREGAELGVQVADIQHRWLLGEQVSEGELKQADSETVLEEALMDVIQWAVRKAALTAQGIDETTRRAVAREIAAWIESGQPLEELVKRLSRWFDVTRARRIAATEVTRAFAIGMKTYWRRTGIVAKVRWNTANDERVCPICAPLGGLTFDDGARPATIAEQERRAQRADLDGVFVHPGGQGILDRFRGRAFSNPPAHPNCRCWLTPVLEL